MSKSAEGGEFKAQRRCSAQVRHSCLRQKALFTYGGPKKKRKEHRGVGRVTHSGAQIQNLLGGSSQSLTTGKQSRSTDKRL